MTQHTIKIEGLQEGWKAVAYRRPIGNIEYVFIDGEIRQAKPTDGVCLIVEKIQPRRIVLEETGEERSVSYGDWYEDDLGRVNQWLNKDYGSSRCVKIWKEVKEQ